MAQVIIYTNPVEGNVCVCMPTGELPIETVLIKDCPPGAIIVDDSILPKGSDIQFFDAWRLNGTTISIDMPTAISFQTKMLNLIAVKESLNRSSKVGAGLSNVLSDADWTTALNTARTAIMGSTTTTQLVEAINPIQTAITNNT